MNEKHTNLIYLALFFPHHLETRDQSLRPRPEVGNVLSFKLFLNKTFCIFLFNFLVYFPFCLCHAKALGSEIGGEHIFGAGGRGSGTKGIQEFPGHKGRCLVCSSQFSIILIPPSLFNLFGRKVENIGAWDMKDGTSTTNLLDVTLGQQPFARRVGSRKLITLFNLGGIRKESDWCQ